MNLDDLGEHIGRIRADLELKKLALPGLLLTDPALGMAVRFQIECLEPRLAELERSALRAYKERSAVLAIGVPV
jgi:hypothetical protein